jgi:hypothetical protein
MADNYIQDWVNLRAATLTSLSAGDPFMIGDYRPCVLLTDAETASPYNATVRTAGIFDMSVKGENDSGNSAVAVGDAIFYTVGDTPKLNKKSSGKLFGVALETVGSGETATIQVLINPVHITAASVNAAALASDAVTTVKILNANVTAAKLATDAVETAKIAALAVTNAKLAADTIQQTKLDRRSTFEEFDANPATCKIAGGAAGGTAGDENVLAFPENNFEYHILGTQTKTAPVLHADGLDVTMDETANDGVEISQGITARSRSAFVVGTDAAFYAKLKIKIPDVSGTDDCAFGFRKAEAYQANIDDYDEMACLNVIAGNITIETILNNAATTSTDTTDDFADGETHTLEVYVSAAGVVTYKIDGVAPTVTAAFTFDAAEVVVPFFYFLHDTDIAEQTCLVEWEVGLQ